MKRVHQTTMATLALMLMFGISCAFAQAANTGDGSKKEKPATEKPSLGNQAKDLADKHGISVGKSTTGEGGKVCKDITKDVKVCVEKDGFKPNSGWSGTVGFTWK